MRQKLLGSGVLTICVITKIHCLNKRNHKSSTIQFMNCYIHCHTKMLHVEFSRDLTSWQSPLVKVTIKKTCNWYLTDPQTRCVSPAATVSKAFTFQNKKTFTCWCWKKQILYFCWPVDFEMFHSSYMCDMQQSVDHNIQLVFKIMYVLRFLIWN